MLHIAMLRKKLGDCGDWIETVRGFGYRLRDEEATPEEYISSLQKVHVGRGFSPDAQSVLFGMKAKKQVIDLGFAVGYPLQISVIHSKMGSAWKLSPHRQVRVAGCAAYEFLCFEAPTRCNKRRTLNA